MCAKTRPRFILSSERGFFGGNAVRSHVKAKGNIPSTGSSEEDRTHDAASRRTASPTHYRLSCSGPLDNSNLITIHKTRQLSLYDDFTTPCLRYLQKCVVNDLVTGKVASYSSFPPPLPLLPPLLHLLLSPSLFPFFFFFASNQSRADFYVSASVFFFFLFFEAVWQKWNLKFDFLLPLFLFSLWW